MKLSELKKGECGKIISINSNPVLKARFCSFGITKNALIYVIEQTIAKNTLEIKIHNTKVAIRVTEAEQIEIESVKCKN